MAKTVATLTEFPEAHVAAAGRTGQTAAAAVLVVMLKV